MGNNKQLIDFITAENELDGQEPVYIAQGGKTRKTLLQKIKEFIIGTNTMGTTATDITGAIAEHTSQLNDIMNERGYVNTKLIIGLDLNTIVKSGIYAGDNLINSPQNDVWYTLEVFNCSNDDYVIQRLMGFADGGTGTFERRKNSTKWTAWQQIATTANPQKIAITPLNGFTLASGSKATYSKTSDGIVNINVFCNNTANAVIGISIFTLPSDYRSSYVVRAQGLVIVENIGLVPCEISIHPDGNVKVTNIASGKTTYMNVQFNISYEIS